MNAKRYSTVAMLLHWAIAIAVIVNWRIIEAAEHAATDAEGFQLVGQHKALGFTILILTLVRLAWRHIKPPPAISENLAGWERMLAKTVHIVFYVLLIGLPIGGWLANSYYDRVIDLFGIVSIPALPVGPNEDTGSAIYDAHAAGGTILLALIVLHVAAALKHTFIDKDGNLWRMLPFGTPRD